MKKSISSRQRQYVGKLFTQSRNPRWDISCYKYFMVFNESMSQFLQLQHLHFLQEVFLKALNVPYMPNRNLQLPKSFIVHVWHFQWRKFEAQYLDNIYVSTSRFFMMYYVFFDQKYYDINIEDKYMTLFLGKSKAIV